NVRPGSSAIHRLVHAVAVRRVAPDARLAHPDVDDGRIRWRDCDGADRSSVEETIGHVAPVETAVVRLPDATAGRPLVEGHLVDRITGDGDDATAARRAGHAPSQQVQISGVDSRGRGRRW